MHEIEAAEFALERIGRLYHSRKVYGDLFFERVHSCHFVLSCIVYRHYAAQCLIRFQGQLVRVTNMSTPLSREIKSVLCMRGVSVVSLDGFRHTRPQPLSLGRPKDPDVQRVLDTHIAKDEEAAYHRSSEERDLSLMSMGYTVLTEKDNKEFDFDVFYDLFLLVSVEMGGDTMEVSECGAVDLLNQVQPSSSSGLLPLNSLHGVCIGSKKKMQNSAVAVNVTAQVWGGVPGCLPFKPAGKSSKKVRKSEPSWLSLRQTIWC